MARTKNIIDENKLAHLKEKVEQKFGRPIVTSKDCHDLTQVLTTLNTNANINPQTIRRLYGLVRNEHSPSVYTLDLLSKYVAGCSWTLYKANTSVNESLKLLADWIFDFYTIHEFGLTKVVDAIAESEELQQLLLIRMASVPSAHWMFFEARPLRDCLNKYYKSVLPIYIENKKNTNEAKLFGYGLLFWGAYFTENLTEIEKYFKLIEATQLTPEIYHIPAARKYGVPLMYYHLKNDKEKFNKVFDEVIIIRKNYMVETIDWQASNFDAVIAEHLLVIGRYEHFSKLWKKHNADKEKYGSKIIKHPHHQEIIRLKNAFCNENYDKNHKYLMKFDINRLRLGERKFYNMLFILCQLKHIKNTSKLKKTKLIKQLEELINDTGYTSFYRLIKN